MSKSKTPAINDAVENIRLPATGEQELGAGDFHGQQLVIYFYPKDNTPGCTTESQGFAEHHQSFRDCNTAIVGVSRDSLKSHDNFRAKYDLPYPLLSDQEETLCKYFDVIKEKNMYGRKVMGIERSTFLIDSEGILRHEWRKVKVPGHVEEVLAAARELHAGN
jgi:thioredoxin-dependent peroxiredoxin